MVSPQTVGELQCKKIYGVNLGYFAKERSGKLKERDDIMEVCSMSEDITPETLISIDRTNIETKTTTATKRVAIAVRDIPSFFFF